MIDPAAVGSAADDNRSADTVYGPRPWTERPRYSYLGPFASNQERLVQQALAVMEIPGDELQEVVRPPLPQVQLFPERFGYRTEALGIADIMDADRYQQDRKSWRSGEGGSYTAASRNTLGNGV